MAQSLKSYFSARGLHNTWTGCMNWWQKATELRSENALHVLSTSKMGRKQINEAQRFGLISLQLYIKIVMEFSYFCFVKKLKKNSNSPFEKRNSVLKAIKWMNSTKLRGAKSHKKLSEFPHINHQITGRTPEEPAALQPLLSMFFLKSFLLQFAGWCIK